MARPRPGMFPPAATKPAQPEPSIPATPATPPKTEAAKLIEYTTPEAWKPKEGSSLRVATFTVSEGEETAELAITQFPKVAQMTDPLANVNRWRGELALPAAKESELPEQTSEMKIGDQPATIFFATGTSARRANKHDCRNDRSFRIAFGLSRCKELRPWLANNVQRSKSL